MTAFVVQVEVPEGTPEGLLFEVEVPLWMPPWNHDDEDETTSQSEGV